MFRRCCWSTPESTSRQNGSRWMKFRAAKMWSSSFIKGRRLNCGNLAQSSSLQRQWCCNLEKHQAWTRAANADPESKGPSKTSATVTVLRSMACVRCRILNSGMNYIGIVELYYKIVRRTMSLSMGCLPPTWAPQPLLQRTLPSHFSQATILHKNLLRTLLSGYHPCSRSKLERVPTSR